MSSYYEAYRPYMRSGDLLEFRGRDALSITIRRVTGEDVNHSATVFRIDEYKYIRDRVFLIEALPSGVQITSCSERLSGYGGKVYWSELKATYEQRDIIVSYSLSLATRKREDKLYDYKGLFENIIRQVGVDVSKVFCSELYHVCLMIASVVPVVDVCCRPGEFAKLGVHNDRQLIYEL